MPPNTYSDQSATEKLNNELPRWTVENNCLHRIYKTSGWKGSLMVTNAIGHLAEIAWHHPDITVCYNRVVVSLTDHEAKGISDKDFELAKKIESFVHWQPASEGGALVGTPDDPRYSYVKPDD